jgi:peptidoglycan hydrolase CwlO-like protein
MATSDTYEAEIQALSTKIAAQESVEASEAQSLTSLKVEQANLEYNKADAEAKEARDAASGTMGDHSLSHSYQTKLDGLKSSIATHESLQASEARKTAELKVEQAHLEARRAEAIAIEAKTAAT